MKNYIVYKGKVTESTYNTAGSKTTSTRLLSGEHKGVKIIGINSDYICDKYGKSYNVGEYLNHKEWTRKTTTCECCGVKYDYNENMLNGEVVNKIFCHN